MEDANPIAAIDVGTSKVCTIIGRKAGQQFEIMAFSVTRCDGLKKGNVANVVATTNAIRASLDQAESAAGVKVMSAYVGVTGAHVAYKNLWSILDHAGRYGVVTPEDVAQVPQKVKSRVDEGGRRVLHVLPIVYSLDGKEGIRNPVGMHSNNLEVETHVVTGDAFMVGKVVEAVRKAGVEVESLVLGPLASNEAVLTPEEREQGAVLVDIGCGTTDLVAFKSGRMQYTAVIPVAGYQFTNDICQTYQTTYKAAEAVKLGYAHTEPQSVHLNEEVTLPVSGSETHVRVRLRDICQLTRERARELIHLIGMKIREASFHEGSDVSVVVTGGASNLTGLRDLMQRALPERVRIAAPNGRWGLPDDLKAPAYSTGVGILVWAANHGGAEGSNGVIKVSSPRLTSRLSNQLRDRMPLGRS